MSKYIRSLNISSPSEEVLALDGNGVTPTDNLSKLAEKDSPEQTTDKVQSLVDQVKPTKELEKATAVKNEVAKKAEIKETLRKHPNIKEYSQDIDSAADEWDYFEDEEYGTCEAVDGSVKELGFFDSLQAKVNSLTAEYGVDFINPQSQDALDRAKTKRLLKTGSGEELTSVYSKSTNKSTIRKTVDEDFNGTASRGSWKTAFAAVKILGKNYVRNRKKSGAKNLLASYKKDPLSMFNKTELDGLTGTLTEMDPEWGGYLVNGVTKYKKGNFDTLSKDAAKLLGVDKNKYFPKVIKIAKKKKWDRKVNERITKAKKSVTAKTGISSGSSGSIYST